jgi:hypothetical protein
VSGSSKSDNYVQVEDKQGSLQSSSNGYLARPDAIHIETHAVHDVESDAGHQPADVRVQKSFSQSSEHVYGKELLWDAQGENIWSGETFSLMIFLFVDHSGVNAQRLVNLWNYTFQQNQIRANIWRICFYAALHSPLSLKISKK